MDNPTIGKVNNNCGNDLQLFISSIISRYFKISDMVYNVITDLKSSSSMKVYIRILTNSSLAFRKSLLVIAKYLLLDNSYADICLKI